MQEMTGHFADSSISTLLNASFKYAFRNILIEKILLILTPFKSFFFSVLLAFGPYKSC